MRGDESSRQRDHMPNNGVELEGEFWPVEHPLEPGEEDRPVKCPIPTASSVINVCFFPLILACVKTPVHVSSNTNEIESIK